jgi:CheY-like chemotaxis protein
MSVVIVVEDDAIIRADIEETLHRLGHEIGAALDNGEDALREVDAQKPDLVLVDIRIRGAFDGVETVRRIRTRSDVPVVYLTSHSDAATFERANETRPNGYLIKPFHERELRTAIEEAMRSSRG